MSKSSLLTVKEAEETWQNDQAEDLKQKFAMFFYKHWPGRSLNAKKWKHTSLDTVVHAFSWKGEHEQIFFEGPASW